MKKTDVVKGGRPDNPAGLVLVEGERTAETAREPTPQPSDNELMWRVRDGEIALLGVLFERHHAGLHRYFSGRIGYLGPCDDLVQDVFIRILRYRRQFRGDGEFRIWMYHIARNVARDFQSRSRRFATAPEDSSPDRDELERADERPLASEILEVRLERQRLRDALARLPDEQRELLVLTRFQNLSYEEVGGLLGCSVGAVKLRVFRALRSLRAIFLKNPSATPARTASRPAPLQGRTP